MISRPQYDLYMLSADLRNFAGMIPEDKRSSVRADFDSLHASVQGMDIGVKVTRRQPYSLITLEDDGAPFRFSLTLHFDSFAEGGKTDFWMELDADLNMMMKMIFGSKIQEAMDKIVDSLVAVSEGRMPEGVDLSSLGFPGSSGPKS